MEINILVENEQDKSLYHHVVLVLIWGYYWKWCILKLHRDDSDGDTDLTERDYCGPAFVLTPVTTV